AALLEEPVTLYGNESLNKRPMGPLMRALKELGAEVSCSRACTPPVTVKGFNWKPRTRIVSVDASISSQFVTALLIISPLLELELLVEGRIRSRPYIDVTLSVLEAYGLRVEREGYRRFRVKGEYRPRHYSVPGDYSSASFILAAGALAGRVLVRGLKQFDPQGDRAILEILASMGAKVRVGSDWVLVENTGGLEAIEADLADYPDLAPIVSVLAAYARGQTVLTGIGHLAYKESNRVEAIVGNLRRIGVEASVKDPETLVIKGGGARGGTVVSYGDHRIAMSFAVAGLRARKGVKILGVDCVRDSYPGFLRDLSSIGANIETIT
ncbi:MAG: 3-phosphoshikimate 1-carboxyvinyltransferase, partial [Desulfurococcales archaeon]|nr:3-phosphoshikimate 1-carboxyvinyltransferase [Desulfurococcales archaeon]